MYALVFGIAYLGVALLDVALGGGPKIGAVTVLQIQLVQNLIHWAVALAVSLTHVRGRIRRQAGGTRRRPRVSSW
jgi:hypothetical protein